MVVRPLADGGEGTTEALVEGLGGEYVHLDVTGPLGETTQAKNGILADQKTAVYVYVSIISKSCFARCCQV